MSELTFDKFDKLNRKEFATRLTTAITKFSPLYDEAYVLSLNAPFGSGKTTFLQMWGNSLKSSGYTVVHINAWETDFDEEPLIPIISKIMDAIPSKKFGGVKKALKSVLGVTGLVADQLLEKTSGISIRETGEALEAESNQKDIVKSGEKIYEEFNYKLRAYDTLREELKSYAATLAHKPLIILVDELDRVRPLYAVKFLEAIKHIFSVQGVCFVIAINKEQLEASVRQLYGKIDFENYYRRFITREASLPAIETINTDSYITYLFNKFIDEPQSKGVSFGFNNQDRANILSHIISVTKAFRLLPRQNEGLLKTFAHLMVIETNNQATSKEWIKAAILLIAINIDNLEYYHRLGNATLSAKILYEYLKKLHTEQHGRSQLRFIMLFTLTFNMRDDDELNKQESIDALIEIEKINASTIDAENREKLYHRFLSPSANNSFYGMREKSGFSEIYRTLEEWRSLIE